jgi:predicted acyl esterase
MAGDSPDRRWRRRGGSRYALARLHGIASPPVTVSSPTPDMVIERDADVTSRDGTVLRANVYRGRGSRCRPAPPGNRFAGRSRCGQCRPRPVGDALPAGEQLHLVVAGRWLYPRNPLIGQVPPADPRPPRVGVRLHWGTGVRRAPA